MHESMRIMIQLFFRLGRSALKRTGLREHFDVLVVSGEKFRYWADTPGNVFYEAAREGQSLYEAA